MDNKKLHNIFNTTECISTEKMIAYQEGKLSEIEKNSVEKHLSSCNMCHDEFEGLLFIPVKTSLPVTVYELNCQVDSILANTNKKIPFLMPINLMAAIILFLIGFAWYAAYHINSLTNMKKELVSETVYKGSKEDREIIIIRPQPSLSESERKLMSKNYAYKETRSNFEEEESREVILTENLLSDDKIAANNEVSESENKSDEIISNPINSGNVVAENDINKEDKKTVVEEDISLVTNKKDFADIKKENKKAKNEKNDASRSKIKSESSKALKSGNFNQAKAEFDKDNYPAAIELFKQSLNQHQAKDEVYYYLAMSYKNIGNHQDALSNYNKVIADEKSPLFEQALWNKSQILLKLEKQKSAVNTLNQIKNLKGNYSIQAEIILDSLLNK